MQRIYPFLRRLARHPRTSAAGIAGLFGSVFAVYRDPAQLAEPGLWITLLMGLGLLVAADSSDDDDGPKPPRLPAAEGKDRKVVPISTRGALSLCA